MVGLFLTVVHLRAGLNHLKFLLQPADPDFGGVLLNFLQLAVSEVVSIVGFTLLLFGAIKVFQIKSELTEIKDLLGDIKRNTSDFTGRDFTGRDLPAASPLQAAYQSPDQVLRSVDDKSYAE